MNSRMASPSQVHRSMTNPDAHDMYFSTSHLASAAVATLPPPPTAAYYPRVSQSRGSSSSFNIAPSQGNQYYQQQHQHQHSKVGQYTRLPYRDPADLESMARAQQLKKQQFDALNEQLELKRQLEQQSKEKEKKQLEEERRLDLQYFEEARQKAVRRVQSRQGFQAPHNHSNLHSAMISDQAQHVSLVPPSSANILKLDEVAPSPLPALETRSPRSNINEQSPRDERFLNGFQGFASMMQETNPTPSPLPPSAPHGTMTPSLAEQVEQPSLLNGAVRELMTSHTELLKAYAQQMQIIQLYAQEQQEMRRENAQLRAQLSALQQREQTQGSKSSPRPTTTSSSSNNNNTYRSTSDGSKSSQTVHVPPTALEQHRPFKSHSMSMSASTIEPKLEAAEASSTHPMHAKTLAHSPKKMAYSKVSQGSKHDRNAEEHALQCYTEYIQDDRMLQESMGEFDPLDLEESLYNVAVRSSFSSRHPTEYNNVHQANKKHGGGGDGLVKGKDEERRSHVSFKNSPRQRLSSLSSFSFSSSSSSPPPLPPSPPPPPPPPPPPSSPPRVIQSRGYYDPSAALDVGSDSDDEREVQDLGLMSIDDASIQLYLHPSTKERGAVPLKSKLRSVKDNDEYEEYDNDEYDEYDNDEYDNENDERMSLRASSVSEHKPAEGRNKAAASTHVTTFTSMAQRKDPLQDRFQVHSISQAEKDAMFHLEQELLTRVGQ